MVLPRTIDSDDGRIVWVGIVLLAAALLVAHSTTAYAVTVAALAGVGWAAVAGGPRAQAAVAVGLVWLMLIGGVRQVLADGPRAGDAKILAEAYWIPRSFWFATWLAIAVASLWNGGRILLGK